MTHAKLRSQDGHTAAGLNALARTFIDLQEVRHLADYEGSRKWTRTEVLEHVDDAAAAFTIWRKIRNETIAHDYLLSLLTGRP